MTGHDRPDAPAPWDDERLADAFAERYGGLAPRDLAAGVLGAVAEARRPRFGAVRRYLPSRLAVAGAAVAVVVAVAGLVGLGGLARIGPFASLFPPAFFTVTPGPEAGLSTFSTESFAFDFPSDWLVYETLAAGSGGSSIAVLTDLPIEPRCGDEHVDINCVYEQPLEPGTMRLFVGTGGYPNATVFDRGEIRGFTTTRTTIGGMPAIRDERFDATFTFYLADGELNWSIAMPGSVSNVVRLESIIRGPWPNSTVVRQVAETFRFLPPPTPFSSDEVGAATAARTAIATLASGLRGSTLGSLDADEQVLYDCFGPEREALAESAIRVGPGGDLGWHVEAACTWDVRRVVDAVGEVDLTVIWTAPDGTSSRYFETLWIDAAGSILGTRAAGDPPPASPTPESTPAPRTPAPLPSPHPNVAFSVDLTTDTDPGPVRIDVVDRSGHLVGARRHLGQISGVAFAGRPLVVASPDDQRTVIAAWTDLPCAGVGVLTVHQDDQLMTLDGGTGRCDPVGVERSIELVFDHHTAATQVTIGRRAFERTDAGPWYLDLPILSVDDALALRHEPDDAREVLVAGWYQPAPPVSCPAPLAPPVVALLQPWCPHEFQWLMDVPERLVTSTANSLSARPPTVPALNPIMPGGDRSWIPDGAVLGDAPPILVIAAGHFDDRNARLCGLPSGGEGPDPAAAAACRDQFLVDAVLWADGQDLGPTYDPRVERLEDGTRVEPSYGALGVGALLGSNGVVAPDTHVIAASPVLGERLGEFEPSLATGAHGLIDRPVVWVVRTLTPSETGPASLRSFVVVDGATEVWEAVPDDWRLVLHDGRR